MFDMAMNTSDLLVERMFRWGIDMVFGMPGDGINGVIEALRKRQKDIRFIQVRHEEAAAFMACAYAKYTGRLGCCLATTGPGGIHLLNGLYDAQADGAPVLAITGETFSDVRGSKFQQDVDLVKLFEDVTVYNQIVINPDQIEMLANEACRHALNHRGVSHISIPVDYQTMTPANKPSINNKKEEMTSDAWTRPLSVPIETELRLAASILNGAKKPVILAGAGALGAREELLAVAEKLGAPIVKALLGKAVIPDEHPLSLGGIGMLGTTPAVDAMENCDAVFIVGSSFPYVKYLPDPDKCVGIQIDDQADRIGLRFPVRVGLVGDARVVLTALGTFIEEKEDRSFLEEMQSEMSDWWELMETQSTSDETPIKPQRVAWELTELADTDAIISGDSGTNTIWCARQFRMRGEQKFSCSGTMASMASGLPYAIAAKLAFPSRQSIAFVGDGGFAMLMGDFVTAVKYKLPITVVIVKNNVLGQIKWEQIVFLGNPEYVVELEDIDFAKFAEACGGEGYTVREPEDLTPTLRKALSSDKPCVVEVYTDPHEPPMPPKVELWQARNFAEALVRGQREGGEIALTMFRDKLNEIIGN
ncbi:MAG TPA: thiamine pyrophosphate-dependent enzyme [Pyrinomonadaceae bacterium]|jgi:pyruvate dehydrogenase (quinone)/pyruvate oxidase